MRIVSWNVNGIRAVARKELFSPMVTELAPDVLLLQETKATPEQIPSEVRYEGIYETYFNSPLEKAGYSGTAIYTKIRPNSVTFGMGVPELDMEGRVLTARYDALTIVNIYFPNGGQGPDRLTYKLRFYEAFLSYVNTLQQENPVVWGGDVNTAHEVIDLARPRENEKNTGFLPEERAWLDEVVGSGWVDTYRHQFPTKEGAYTYWDMKTHARERNVGWRIDYLFISPTLLPVLKKSSIHSAIIGSDHCPISIDLNTQ